MPLEKSQHITLRWGRSGFKTQVRDNSGLRSLMSERLQTEIPLWPWEQFNCLFLLQYIWVPAGSQCCIRWSWAVICSERRHRWDNYSNTLHLISQVLFLPSSPPQQVKLIQSKWKSSHPAVTEDKIQEGFLIASSFLICVTVSYFCAALFHCCLHCCHHSPQHCT